MWGHLSLEGLVPICWQTVCGTHCVHLGIKTTGAEAAVIKGHKCVNDSQVGVAVCIAYALINVP